MIYNKTLIGPLGFLTFIYITLHTLKFIYFLTFFSLGVELYSSVDCVTIEGSGINLLGLKEERFNKHNY